MPKALLVLVLVVLGALPAQAQTNTTCTANAYALCSHALCTCLDSSGAPAACPTDDSAVAPVTWASCTCPVVSVGPSPEYNANIGNTACLQRSATALPAFATPLPQAQGVQLIYSQYSLGDAVPDDSFGTLSGARMQQCPPTDATGARAQFANCLDQPCYWDGTSDEALCYCPVNPARSDWNTFTTACGSALCATPPGTVWSAAGVDVTKEATGYLQAIVAAAGRVPPAVSYCPPG